MTNPRRPFVLNPQMAGPARRAYGWGVEGLGRYPWIMAATLVLPLGEKTHDPDHPYYMIALFDLSRAGAPPRLDPAREYEIAVLRCMDANPDPRDPTLPERTDWPWQFEAQFSGVTAEGALEMFRQVRDAALSGLPLPLKAHEPLWRALLETALWQAPSSQETIVNALFSEN